LIAVALFDRWTLSGFNQGTFRTHFIPATGSHQSDSDQGVVAGGSVRKTGMPREGKASRRTHPCDSDDANTLKKGSAMAYTVKILETEMLNHNVKRFITERPQGLNYTQVKRFSSKFRK
jgi:hypothetical protein